MKLLDSQKKGKINLSSFRLAIPSSLTIELDSTWATWAWADSEFFVSRPKVVAS